MTELKPHDSKRKIWTLAQRTAAVFMILAGYIGATVFIHSDGLFVTFMTGNAQKNMIGIFQGNPTLSQQSIVLTVSFFMGVFLAALCRRRVWKDRPCCVVLITTISLAIACSCIFISGEHSSEAYYWFWSLPFIALGTGALNGAFTAGGETKTPVTYHTGSLVKFAQAVEKHFSLAGTYHDWVPHAISYGAFSLGAAIGGVISIFMDPPHMLVVATIFSLVIFIGVHHIREQDL